LIIWWSESFAWISTEIFRLTDKPAKFVHFRWLDHNLVENATSISINSWTLCPISLCSFCERKTRKPVVGSCKKHTDHAIKFDHWVPMNSEKFLRKMDRKIVVKLIGFTRVPLLSEEIPNFVKMKSSTFVTSDRRNFPAPNF
jgi:uncharacterized membrane protein